MKEQYYVMYSRKNGTKNNVEHWQFKDFDSALKAAKWASLKGATMVSVWHRLTGKLICYCVDGAVA